MRGSKASQKMSVAKCNRRRYRLEKKMLMKKCCCAKNRESRRRQRQSWLQKTELQDLQLGVMM